MTPPPGSPDREARRERIIAGVLRCGTWLATALVAVGLMLDALPLAPLPRSGPSGLGVASAGVALFILLPIARVALMAVLFLRERDVLYATIATLVLAIVATGVFVELRLGT